MSAGHVEKLILEKLKCVEVAEAEPGEEGEWVLGGAVPATFAGHVRELARVRIHQIDMEIEELLK